MKASQLQWVITVLITGCTATHSFTGVVKGVKPTTGGRYIVAIGDTVIKYSGFIPPMVAETYNVRKKGGTTRMIIQF